MGGKYVTLCDTHVADGRAELPPAVRGEHKWTGWFAAETMVCCNLTLFESGVNRTFYGMDGITSYTQGSRNASQPRLVTVSACDQPAPYLICIQDDQLRYVQTTNQRYVEQRNVLRALTN